MISACLALGATAPLRAADQNRLDTNPTLFAVMAALQAGGFDLGAATPITQPVRDAITEHLRGKKLQVVSELANFVATHHRGNAGADLAPYISFALAVNDPPEFTTKFRSGEVPPDVIALEGFDRLMVRFYKDAEIEKVWTKVQPLYEKALEREQAPVIRTLTEVNAYLRNPTSGYMGRRFIVFVDLVGPASKTHSRSYGDDYYIVVTASGQPETDEIRHGYLHYLLDPLSVKYSEQVNKKKGFLDLAELAPALDDSYKFDFLLLTTECLIKGIEIRMNPGSVEKRKAAVNAALAQGFVMTPYFAEQLPFYEKQDVGMRLYFPDLVNAIDLKREAKRLEGVEFASAPAQRPLVERPKLVADLTPAQKSLQEAERLSDDKQYPQSREAFMKVLQQTEDHSLHSRAYFGLARIAALDKNPELAEKLFRKTLEVSPDSRIKSWAEYYLGRLSELAGEDQEAAQHFEAVLKIEGAAPAAKQEAEKALKAKAGKN